MGPAVARRCLLLPLLQPLSHSLLCVASPALLPSLLLLHCKHVDGFVTSDRLQGVTGLLNSPIPQGLTQRDSSLQVATRSVSSAIRPSTITMTYSDGQTTDLPLASLLEACLEACQAMTPFIRSVYELLCADSTGATLKKDQSFFSLADGIVQQLLTRLLQPYVGCIVGEEDSSSINIEEAPFFAGTIYALPEFEPFIQEARDKIDALRAALAASPASHAAAWRDLTAFIDPIDGTREFCTARGEQCTVCIGFADKDGRALAGVLFRPIDQQPTWAIGCADENVARSRLRGAVDGASGGDDGDGETTPRPGFVCSNGPLSPFVTELAAQLGVPLVRSGGAANKVLLLLENAGCCYIQDRGLSRWDTCAAQAVLEAHGGVLSKLSTFQSAQQLQSYRYISSSTNSDFEPNLTQLTKYNAANGAAPNTRSGGSVQLAASADQLLPYANACGILALPQSEVTALKRYAEAIKAAADKHKPIYS